MRARTKIALVAAAAIASSALYGNLRFNFSRYEPQYEQLPHLSIYGKSPQESDIRRGYSSFDPGLPQITLRLRYEKKWKIVRAVYPVDEKRLNSIFIGNDETRLKPPLQLVVGPLNALVMKGSWGCEAAYLGLKEIFETPKPMVIDIPNEHLMPLPPGHGKLSRKAARFDKEIRELYDSLATLSQKIQGYDQWKVHMAGKLLARELEKPSDLLGLELEEIQQSLKEMGNRQPPEVAKPFWKGWDYMFGAAIVGMLGLCALSLFKKYKLAAGEKMDEKEKKREELKKEFENKLDELYPRVDKAETIEKCQEIGREYEALYDKLEREDPELFDMLRMERVRFEDLLDGKIESLGGPKITKRYVY